MECLDLGKSGTQSKVHAAMHSLGSDSIDCVSQLIVLLVLVMSV